MVGVATQRMTRGLCRRRAWQRSIMKKGVPVSPGIAVARAYCVDAVLARRRPEVLPSQAMTFDRMRVAGIITEAGGATGHAAILARSLGIPAVSGLRGILREVHTGDLVALDGREGHVYLNPGSEVEAAYRKLQREYGDLRNRLIENRELEAITADGVPVEL